MSPLDALQGLTHVPLAGTSGRVILHDCGRKHLRAWWKALRVTIGAEIGVWEGQFARSICESTGAFLYAVDPWAPQPDYIEVKNNKARLDHALNRARSALVTFPHQIVRATSLDAVKKFADRSLDFVYIDGNHMKPSVLADLAAWTPKVKIGGVMSGHDYRLNSQKPFIQVPDAINEYTAEHRVSPWFVFAADKSPSWAWVVS